MFDIPLYAQKNPGFDAGAPKGFGVEVLLFRSPSANQSPNFPKKKLKNSVSYPTYAKKKNNS
jgi:hypothetical protein